MNSQAQLRRVLIADPTLLDLVEATPGFEPQPNPAPVLKETESGTRWPALIADAALIGPAGEFVRTVAPHTEADPAALLLQFLSAFGCMAGRFAHFRAEADFHYPNIYACLVGETSRGRKGTSWGYVRSVLSSVDEEFSQNHIKGGLSSGEGVIFHLRDAAEEDAGVTDKRLLILETEFSSALRVMGRDGNTLSAQLRQTWDSGTARLLTKNNPLQATGTHLSLVAHITKPELVRYLNSTECANGFGNRILWACVKRSRLLPEGGNLERRALDGVAQEVRSALAFAKSAGELKRDGEARKVWIQAYAALSAGRHGLLGALLARTEAQTMRVALIYALLDQSPAIRREHLEAALAVTDFCEESAEYIFGDLYGDEVADRILQALRDADAGITRTEVSDLFTRHKPQSAIEAALRTLEREGLIQKRREDSGGRPIERWIAGGAR